MTNQTRSIDYRAPDKEWEGLFRWIEENTRLVMKSNNPNPWFKKPVSDEEAKAHVHSACGWMGYMV